MVLEINYYGILADIIGQNQEELEIENPTYTRLIEVLHERYPQLKNTPFKIASENQILEDEAPIIHHNIALLPPFSGG